ncbi:MAG: single-stranded DNA-binding protein [Flavobacteriia bacterium]|jgi:single stranded DNA-binding protein|nr:single-stranded DNA-binding protein [Flavobacteriia bacterium]NBV68132.1 single-stranded DNA-binding protein [Flavobacteriia bacterium]NBV91195.1 single-stranded DNA-binding protein [Flavobacteriia bacterium]NBY40512.1 single-stranded DNA-binding protein [Flavobacteriia bacterium]
MATVFETRLIGNIGKDALVKQMERGIIAVNFPVAHNKNWRDKKTGVSKTKTTWVNCTIWKKEGSHMRIVDFLKKGALVELTGTPFAKAYTQEDGNIRTEIRLNVSDTNILRPAHREDETADDLLDTTEYDVDYENQFDDFTLSDEDF